MKKLLLIIPLVLLLFGVKDGWAQTYGSNGYYCGYGFKWGIPKNDQGVFTGATRADNPPISFEACTGKVTISDLKYYETNESSADDYVDQMYIYLWIDDIKTPIWQMYDKNTYDNTPAKYNTSLNYINSVYSELRNKERYLNLINLTSSISMTYEAEARNIQYSYGSASSAPSDPGLQEKRGMHLKIMMTNLPQGAFKYGQIRFTVEATMKNGCNTVFNTGYNQNLNKDLIISLPTISPPTNFVASDNECKKIKLNWVNGIQSNGCPAGNYGTQIYINQNTLPLFLNPLGSTVTNFERSANVAFAESYRLVTTYQLLNGPLLYSSEVIRSGSASVPSIPIGFNGPSGSPPNCTGNVPLSWSAGTSISKTNIDNWKIQRSGDDGVTWTLIKGDILASASNYTDVNVPTNKTYKYRLSAINCNGEGAVSEISVFAPGKPALAQPDTAINFNKGGYIQFKWKDLSDNETKFRITRTATGAASGILPITVEGQNIKSYNDSSVVSCVTYQYSIRAINECSNDNDAVSSSFRTATLLPDITEAFDNISYKLKASKGFYADRVQLEWSNKFKYQIDGYQIERKITNGGTFAVIATVSNSSNIYIDNTALPNIVYSYKITGQSQCAGFANNSNSSEDIGFRSPFGLLSGNITYAGGTAVKGVKVTANSAGAAGGTSLLFDGKIITTDSCASTVFSNAIDLKDSLTVELWARPILASNNNKKLVEIRDFTSSNKLVSIYHNNRRIYFSVNNGTTTKTLNTPDSAFLMNQYTQITCTMRKDSMHIYINGLKKASLAIGGYSFSMENCKVGFGSSLNAADSSFNGNIDEVRVWKTFKDTLAVKNDFNRFVAPDETNLVGYWSFDENIPGLNSFFDQSKTSFIFNETHGTKKSTVQWSNIIPGNTLLSNASYTDEFGNFLITNIKYVGAGQNYTITPNYSLSGTAHKFTPSIKPEYIGDGAALKSGINFIDNNKFDVTVYIKYKGTTCPVEGATVKIDNIYPLRGGQLIKTDADGKCMVEMPDGEHRISVEKLDHVFNVGEDFINYTGPFTHYFQDSTRVKVVGRVVGGSRELNKVPNLGRSKNNIGQARIIFNSTIPCKVDTVVTNDTTGEYEILLPPLDYTVRYEIIKNAATITAALNNPTINANKLDLQVVPRVINLVDTFRNPNGSFSEVKTTWYQTRLDARYFTPAVINVRPTDSLQVKDVNDFIGEKILNIGGVNRSISNGELDYPVFLQDKIYSANIFVSEKYTNSDKSITNPVIDIVPVIGTLNIDNNFLAIPSNRSLRGIRLDSGFYRYSFKAGAPNQSKDGIFSYTQTIEVSYQPPVGATATWQPNNFDGGSAKGKLYRGYVFGAKSSGANFTTSGPALVDLILRDPPGTLSYSSWQSGKTRTTTSSSSLVLGEDSRFEDKVLLGVKATAQFGAPGATIETESEALNSLTFGTTTVSSINNNSEFVETISSNTTISTSGDPGKVGAGYDLFYGKANNLIFGLTDNLKLMDVATCAIRKAQNNGVDVCYGKAINGYKVGLSQGFFLVPGEVKTTFVYTTNEIENNIIPGLIGLRNTTLNSKHKNKKDSIKYHAIFKDTNDVNFKLKFGSNNDDPIWGINVSTNSPYTVEGKDSIGESYIFRADSLYEVDSIRYYNNQIRLWKNALARNEKEKYEAFRNPGASGEPGGTNISIGESSIQQDFTSENTETKSETYELQLGSATTLQLGTTLNGFGVETNGSLTVNKTTSNSNSTSVSNRTTLTYFLKDGDAGDLISVDIVDGKKGDGHIFRLIAGATSCPYEGATKAKYFNPFNDIITATTQIENGVLLSKASAKREVPEINITPSVLFNVPAKEAGVFTLSLKNLSESGQDMTYALRVNEATNKDGAILKVDGLDPNRSFIVPYGAEITKTLTVERGSLKYDYNNIQLILKSTCEESIFDTLSLSIKFIPTCTNVNFLTPDDRWVLNNSFRDTFPITIGSYNYNFGGLDNIRFQYRPASSATWFNQHTFYKDPPQTTPDGKKYKIPLGRAYIDANDTSNWLTKSLPDGNYEIRTLSECKAPGYPNAFVYSPILQGVIDRVNPAPFGTPSPGDGILDPNDDISIQFNEAIDISSLTRYNFDVRGVLNGSNLQTNTSLYFDADNDFMELPNGINLANKAFTIELLAKRGTLGTEQCLVSQGIDANQNFWFGFNQSNQLVFKIGNEMVISDDAFTNQISFSNYAVSYSPITRTVSIYVNGDLKKNVTNTFISIYQGAGKVFVGKSSQGLNNYYNGNILDLRIWGVARTTAQIQANLTKTLTGKEVGILGNWRIDEAEGNSVRDYVRNRTGIVNGAAWQIDPAGSSYSFDGVDDYVATTSSNMAILKEMDFTIEFWVKSNQLGAATLLSNGKGDSTNGGITWTIEKTATGTLVFKHFGSTYTIVEGGLFDNTWHHVALVMQRNSTLTSYLDGNLQKSYLASFFNELGGPRITVGGRNWLNENNYQTVYDNFFNGKIDEVRFWDVARTQELIKRDKQNRLLGEEPGLRLYLPFESYSVSPTGIAILTPSIDDFADTTHKSTSVGGGLYSVETPTIKLPRPVQNIAFTYAINNDKIILTPTVDPAFIENVTLDITAKNVKDLRGNTMQSPKTWIAYINKNQVKWSDNEVSFQKVTLGALSFTTSIINTGGALKTYNIQNLPAWLTASAPTGTVSPNSTKLITFTVNPTVNIGTYEEALSLVTDFGYPEKLVVKLKVYANEPNWPLNSEKYANSMSVIGQLKIGNVISSNTDDLLAAFVDGECRGKAKVQYFSSLDKYFVFLDIFGDTNNKNITFKIWNANEGKMHDDVIPNLTFVGNDLKGSIGNPIVFNADDKLSRIVPLKDGWNWISFNLLSKDSNNLNKLFSNLKLEGGEIVRGQTTISDFNVGKGWMGGLSKPNEGFKVKQSYRFRSNGLDTLILSGVEANPLDQIISAQTGWNWIGFVSQRNMEINEAFSTFTPASGDLLKSQNSFAIYDSIIGWVGSLNTLRPNLGYMYKAQRQVNITYPRFGMLGKKTTEVETVLSQRWQVDYHKYANNMNIIAQLDLCKDMQADGALLLGAFVNNELRGLCKAVLVENKLQYYLTIAGEVENETVEFYLMDENTGKTTICNETTSFVSNSLLGFVSKSMLLTAASKFECTVSSKVNEMEVKVYPNPTTQTDLLKLSINLPKQQEVTIEVFDIKGQQIHAIPTVLLSKGIQIISVFEGQSNITSGVYIIKVKTEDTVKQIKFIQQ